MNSGIAYKWQLNKEGTLFAYITNEEDDEPFLYNTKTGNRISYSDYIQRKAFI